MKSDSTSRALMIAGLGIEALLVAILRLGDLGANVPEAVLAQLLIGTLYLASTFLILRMRDSRRLPLWLILGFALLFRVTVWPLYPTLTDDLYRYRWEGMVQDAGGNPYEARPNDARWDTLRDPTFGRVGGRDFKTGYGPLAQAIDLATYRSVSALTSNPWSQVFWFKLPAALFDVLTIGAVLRLLRSAGLSASRVLIYAWSPAPLIEFWVNGHNDAIAVFWVVLALAAALGERWGWALLWLALGAAVKVWPLALFPLFLVEAKRRRVHVAAAAAPAVVALAALAAPYWTDVWENIRHMSGFVGGWRNNDSVFGLTLWLTGDLYRAKYVTFAVIAAVIGVVSFLKVRLTAKVLVVTVALLALSANCHPWYATWFLPLLAVEPFVPLFVWAALMPIAYDVVTGWRILGQWNGLTPLRWYVHAPFYALLITYWLWSVRYNRGRCDRREFRRP